MADDLYAALGVDKSASDADVKKAYRKIVRTSHPDINPDDPEAEARFKRASAAYDLLKDPETRARYDAGEIDATGAERPERKFYREYTQRPEYAFRDEQGFGSEGAGGAGAQDFFSDLFGRRGHAGAGAGYGRGSQMNLRGSDLHFTMEIDFLEAALGATREISLPTGDRLSVRIPEGTADGQTIRLRGKGDLGYGDGPRGDALVTVTVRPHPEFRREGQDILVTLPITLDEAVLGGKVEAPTIRGKVSLTVPKGASSGQVLRLRGRGVKGGDQRVELRIVTPPDIDDELAQFMEDWRTRHGYNPRGGLGS